MKFKNIKSFKESISESKTNYENTPVSATKYWIPTISEAEEFLTYSFETHPMNNDVLISFYKKPVPLEVKAPAKSIEGEMEKAEQWWKLTNREDLIVLENEKESFDAYYASEKAEITKHL